MFKLESYITPVILSYVEKYIKNFKPEQSQVSLWGGDASFQNLDLRLEVLEEQFNLPFTFISGHIHELLIHVPWVKITSEPIVVTINTIECILKLKDKNQTENVSRPSLPGQTEIPQDDSSQGYIKSIVTKVINNITINCNNLILKYAEEDIVLSINVKFLSMQSVNEEWEPSFIDSSSHEIKLQKIIKVQDLTLCLDKMDLSGKIEIYQDPVLYRCSMTVRLIMNYHSKIAKHTSLVRFDVHCQKMEFSITEQQVPMILRLITLLLIFHSEQSKSKDQSTRRKEIDSSHNEEHIQTQTLTRESGWAMWAWNVMSSVLPMDWENNWSNQQHLAYLGHVINFGIYIDDATLTFKTIDNTKEMFFYKPRKIKYRSFLSIRLTEAMCETILQGISMTTFNIGFGSISLYPNGACSCGHPEVADARQPPQYLIAGKCQVNYLKDTLFDNNAIENQGKKKLYKKDLAYHLSSVSVSELMKKSPAFCMDYVHFITLSDDVNLEQLAQFQIDYEYCNFPEECHIRYGVGNLILRLNSGLFHRLNTIKDAACQYDYTLGVSKKSFPAFEELSPVTVEEYEALKENIPMTYISLNIIRSAIQIKFADHRQNGISQQQNYIQEWTSPLIPALLEDLYLDIECELITVNMEQPLYPFRLVSCASRQIEVPSVMKSRCYRDIKFQFLGITSHLHLKQNQKASVIMPCNFEYDVQTLFYPDYWKLSEINHCIHNFTMDGITFTGSKAKIMVIYSIISSLLYPEDHYNLLLCSSLFADACDEKSCTYLEIYLEHLSIRGLVSMYFTGIIFNIRSIKIFAFNELEQAFIVSGPEIENIRNINENQNLFKLVIQFSKNLSDPKYPQILSFEIAPLKCCLDPLLFNWLHYEVIYQQKSPLILPSKLDTAHFNSHESAISDPTSKKKLFPNLDESVHSSSEKDKKKKDGTEVYLKKYLNKTDDAEKLSSIKETLIKKSGFANRLICFHQQWKDFILNGLINHIIIYIPSKIISGIGSEGIDEAKDKAFQNYPDLHILKIILPIFSIRTFSVISSGTNHFNSLPILLSESIQNQEYKFFPWIIELLNFECTTMKNSSQQKLIKKNSFKATLDVLTKTSSLDIAKNILSFNLNIYIETSPIIISASEHQIMYLENIFKTISSTWQTSREDPIINDGQNIPFSITRSASPILLYPEDGTTTSTISGNKENECEGEDNLNYTAFIQWTITKISLRLHKFGEQEYSTSKLVLELEDIITSIEIQPIYFKLKHRISTVNIFHFKRESNNQNWNFGDYMGLILCRREDNLKKNKDLGFINLTLTRAKSGNVYFRWSGQKSHTIPKMDHRCETLQINSYITEVIINIETIDIIVPIKVLAQYTEFFTSYFDKKIEEINANEIEKKNVLPTFFAFTKLKNENLPLFHLDFKGFRLMFPLTEETIKELQHDLIMLQVENIQISPQAENPICREPFRSDIYQLAAQANILNIPGSAVEDRQYQMNVNGITVHTTNWKDYQESVTQKVSQSFFYTMNENPAVEWNKLSSVNSMEPYFTTLLVVARFDFSVILAPAIILKPNIVVCGSAAELNCITDLELFINFNQIKLLSLLCSQLKSLKILKKSEMFENFQNGNISVYNSLKCDFKDYLSKQVYVECNNDYIEDDNSLIDLCNVRATDNKKSHSEELCEFCPCEFSINAGKIAIIMYDMHVPNNSAKILIENEDQHLILKRPLVYFMINQLNIYSSQYKLNKKFQVSIFDIALVLGENEDINLVNIPTEEDFKMNLIETKSGEPDLDTGIPPSFLVIKYDLVIGNKHLYVDIGRPTKLYFSLCCIDKIQYIQNQLLESSMCGNSKKINSKFSYKNGSPKPLTNFLRKNHDFPEIFFSTKQVVISLSTRCKEDILFSLENLSIVLKSSSRPQRIYTNINWESFIISTILESKTSIFLNPFTGSAILTLSWESWQSYEDLPIFKILIESDGIHINIGPNHLLTMKALLYDYRKIFENIFFSGLQRQDSVFTVPIVCEQNYTDDLKSGAFQFTEGSVDELPFPYQVVFSTSMQIMTWRYPHPRALTRINVASAPLEFCCDTEGNSHQYKFAVDYWNDSKSSYDRYVEFYFSNKKSYCLDLPDKVPLQISACIWRIVLLENIHSKRNLSIIALNAFISIDSYFNPFIIPKFQVAISVCNIQLSFYNHLTQNYYKSLPPPLKNFKLHGIIPEDQCFALLKYKKANFLFKKWPNNSLHGNLSGSWGFYILDYSLLVMQEILDNAEIKIQISTGDNEKLCISSNFFSLKISPSLLHTIFVSYYLWINILRKKNDLVLTTRYVVTNNTNISIRFGQSETEDNILLESKQCHFYSWRYTNNQLLRIAVGENGWCWSKSFSINTNGIFNVEFTNSTQDVTIFVKISSLSGSQKLITFSGQLLISNQLIEDFEMKLVQSATRYDKKDISEIFQISSNFQSASIVLIRNTVALRLRFSTFPNLAWSGDIPLQPNTRWGQPWLVKVPLQDRGQFMSIWVRIITELISGKETILAILSPIYKIKSYLPISAKVHIETPSLKVSLNTVISGCGKSQQVYCPGTYEHFHQLTFKIGSGISSSNPYIPLSYSCVDQRKFFKRPEKENIFHILDSLESLEENSKWPFQNEELYSWQISAQPQTHVQVNYEDAGLASSTLLLELKPWCLMLNSIGTQISIITQDIEVCKVPHYGIVAPPKLEGKFHIGVEMNDSIHISSALYLVKSNWNQSFYSSRTKNLIPLEGTMKTCIYCSSCIMMISVNSIIYKNMQIIRIKNNYVIGNMSNYNLNVSALAIQDSITNMTLTHNNSWKSIGVPAFTNKRYAIPIIQWFTLFESTEDHYVLYILLGVDDNPWSCPVQVDHNLSRRCVAVPQGKSTIPFVVTTQEEKGTVYIIIHIDKNPQFFIENMCSFEIFFGQANEKSDDIVKDVKNFSWRCKVERLSSSHYSMPSMGNKLPELLDDNTDSTFILVSALSNIENSYKIQNYDQTLFNWSEKIDLSVIPEEKIIQFPNFGDIKLTVQKRCYTTDLRFSPLTQVNVSAQEIRNKIERKKTLPNVDSKNADHHLYVLEEDVEKFQSTSSFSSTTFFSAHDEPVEANSWNFHSLSKKIQLEDHKDQTVNNFSHKNIDQSQGMEIQKSVTINLEGISLILLKDTNCSNQRIEIASLSIIEAILMVVHKNSCTKVNLRISDLQLDNQMFENGGFDFPVILLSQKPLKKYETLMYQNLKEDLESILENSFLNIDSTWDSNQHFTVCKDVAIKIAPVNVYVEGTYITILLDFMTSFTSPCFIIQHLQPNFIYPDFILLSTVYLPQCISVNAETLTYPLRLEKFLIEPVSILISLQTSVHLFVAFDHSPLYFESFERKNIMITPYKFGNALAMHYLSGALFGVGWVVGSLEILGSPGGLAQALGTGIKDFVSMPYQGLLQGPWEFVVGITHGSASLIKHITAGTVNSVTKLASSVARNLDRLTLDDEHLQRQEEFRRLRPVGVAEGFYQGLTEFGISLLAAVAGLAHHPLQHVWSGETSTRGLVTGVGLGLVGAVTKPLSGAAELIARTGQGLLQGTGWISLPMPRQRPIIQYSNGCQADTLRYQWRLMPLLEKNNDSILYITSADFILHPNISKSVILVITRRALLVVNSIEDCVEKIYALKDLTRTNNLSDPSLLKFTWKFPKQSLSKSSSEILPKDEEEVQMNQEMRARVADFLRINNTEITSSSTNSDGPPVTFEPNLESLFFYINPDFRSCILSILNIAKRQNQSNGFHVV